MKIYTRTGDAGGTALFGGTRVSKDNPRVAAYGDVDELNACLGSVRAQGELPGDVAGILEHIQKDLFALGARLADPRQAVGDRAAKAALGDADVQRLEEWIDRFDVELPPLRRFILPGGGRAGAGLHRSRTVCRRAERSIVALGTGAVEAPLLAYINRLSDLLFVLARAVNHRSGHPEVEW
jgi:cob(I)alamin adenosyltransferase